MDSEQARMKPQALLKEFQNNDLLAEIRRRDINPRVIERALDLSISAGKRADFSASRLRFYALIILGVLATGLIVVISVLAVYEIAIPDLLSGLAGSCIGAVAGILAGSGGSGETTSHSDRPSEGLEGFGRV